MKIIDIAICVNNIDPKGIGRIRYRPLGIFTSEREGGARYEEWDENDPFIALPFLPLHINIVPQIQQSVKLITYETEKATQNVEYIGGPYTSPHDIQNQTFLAQHKDTTFGGVYLKDVKNIRNKDGSFNSPASRGAVINERDIGFRGNYGSDIIFTENGVQIRGGSLLSKQGKNKKTILEYPQLAKKMGRFTLKKFGKTLENVTEVIDSSKVAVSKLKYVIEYEINDLNTPTELKLFVYKIVGEYGTKFNTDEFGGNTVFNSEDTSLVKLINTGNTLNEPSYVKQLNGSIQEAYIELRGLLHLIDNENLQVLNSVYSGEDAHPFYFRPTSNFKLLKGASSTEKLNKETFLKKVEIRRISGGSGLIFSRQTANPPIIPNKKTLILSKEVKGGGEQSFSNLSADKIYITSTNPNTGVNVKSINFSELDDYELTQEDYVNRIDPNTYAMVRGENLYNILIAIKNLLDSHIHNINEPMVQTDENWVKLTKLIETMRDDILNNSIRIN